MTTETTGPTVNALTLSWDGDGWVVRLADDDCGRRDLTPAQDRALLQRQRGIYVDW